jgi:surface protein
MSRSLLDESSFIESTPQVQQLFQNGSSNSIDLIDLKEFKEIEVISDVSTVPPNPNFIFEINIVDLDFVIPLKPGTFNFTAYWGDGTSTDITNDNYSDVKFYDSPGSYTLTIVGQCEGFGGDFESLGYIDKITNIKNWGNVKFHDQGGQLANTLLIISAEDYPDLTGITNLSNCFNGSTINSPNLIGWDVSQVTNMGFMFSSASNFNQPIGSWDVRNVANMEEMFAVANSFKQDISAWNPESCSNMTLMFDGVDMNLTGTTTNYDNLLNSWVSKNLQTGITFHGGNSQYSLAGKVGRDILTAPIPGGKGWIITQDGGLIP